jgi:hypothetical protein
MVQPAVRVAQSEDECWLRTITRDTYHDAVRGALFLDLDPWRSPGR